MLLMTTSKTVYVSIGNSDDKLTQKEWAAFCREVDALFRMYARQVYGSWRSTPDVEWQNACWCIDFASVSLKRSTRAELARLAKKYRQDSIAWAEAVTTFVAPDPMTSPQREEPSSTHASSERSEDANPYGDLRAGPADRAGRGILSVPPDKEKSDVE